MHFSRFVLAVSAAVIALSSGAAHAQRYGESTPWVYSRTVDGGLAESCQRYGGDRVCAMVVCLPNGELIFGVDGFWLEDDRPGYLTGELRIDRISARARFQREPDLGRGDDFWEMLPNRPDRLRRHLKRGSSLEIWADGYRDSLRFTLSGSRKAIRAVERRCGVR